MLTDRDILLLCALLIFVAARGEPLLCVSERIKRALGLLGVLVLVLAACLGDEGGVASCDDCHRDCGTLRSECHRHCDEVHCLDGEQLGAGGAGEDGAE